MKSWIFAPLILTLSACITRTPSEANSTALDVELAEIIATATSISKSEKTIVTTGSILLPAEDENGIIAFCVRHNKNGAVYMVNVKAQPELYAQIKPLSLWDRVKITGTVLFDEKHIPYINMRSIEKTQEPAQ